MAHEALIKWTHLAKVLDNFGKELVEVYIHNLDQRSIHATHKLAESVRYEIVAGERSMAVDISLAEYWKYIEYGRKAGKFPPLENIEQWIKVKGIQPMTRTQASVKRWTQHKGSIRKNDGSIPSIKSLAYLIGRKIKEEGIQPRPVLSDAIATTMKRFEEAINEAITLDIHASVDVIVTELYKISR